MKTNYKLLLFTFLLLTFSLASLGSAATIQDFDNPGTPYTINNISGTPASLISEPINKVMRMAYWGINYTQNVVAFDRSDTGLAGKIIADFDFRMF
jgi:hypothetical protein